LSDAEADDAAQEVFLIVAHKLTRYEERGALRSWLFAIARLVARQMRRADMRRQRGHASAEPPRPYPDPEQVAECHHQAALVQRFVDELDEEQASVFLLSEVESLTAREIADALELKLSTVLGRQRLSRKRFEAFLRRHAQKG
jgi:RNA polymerase sigma-70 factor (ECF subfamily)